MNSKNLFRPEVSQKDTSRKYGSPLKVGSNVLRHLTLGSVLALLTLCLLASSFPYSRKLRATGVVIPSSGVARVASPQSGIISRVFVADGTTVQTGSPLFEITSDRQVTPSVSAADSAIETIQKRRAIARAANERQRSADERKLFNLQAKERQYRRESDTIREQLASQNDRLSTAMEQFRRDENLVKEGFLPLSGLAARRDGMMEQQQRKAELERIVLANERERTSLLMEVEEIKGKALQSQSDLEDKLQVLGEEQRVNEARKSIVVNASHSGTFEGLAATKGNFVSEGQMLGAVIDSAGKTRVDIFIPTFAAAAPEVGMPVMVSIKAFPFQKYGLLHGRISNINEMAVSGRELSHLPVKLDMDQLYFRAAVDLSGSLEIVPKLASGMAVDAVIKIEEKPLIGWLFDSASKAVQRASL